MSNAPTKPQNTPTPSTLVIDVNQFSANKVKVSDQHRSNAWTYGAVTSILLGGVGYFISRKAGTEKMLWSIGGGAAGGAIAGALFGHHIKTDEETRSEAFIDAARSGSFETRIKSEMEQRENGAFSKGVIVGALTGGWWFF